MSKDTGTNVGEDRAGMAGAGSAARYEAKRRAVRGEDGAPAGGGDEAVAAAERVARLTAHRRTTRLMWVQRLRWAWGLERPDRRDAGMVTSEYAVGLLAAVGFAGLLYKIVTGGSVQEALEALVTKALNV